MFFFFVVAPFCSCPASLVSRKVFAVGPGCAKCFFFVALRWAPRRFGGARAKKNTPPGCFFVLRPRGKAGEGEAPCRHGARAKKKTPPRVCFFLLRPRRKAREGEAPLGAGTEPEQKKKHHPGCVFFALAPCRRPTGLLLPLPFPGAGAKKKNTLGGVFFCSGPVPARGFSFPAFPRGRSKKINTLGGVFFFCCGPARTLTHSLRAWVAMPPPRRGGAFFLLRPRPDRGGAFFAVAPPGRSLTHSLWAGAISARPGWCFFVLLRPRRVFLDNNKKCLGYYIGSKKTRRGHSKKKHHFGFGDLMP